MVMCRVLLEGWNGRKVGDGIMLSDLEAIPMIAQGIVETADGSTLEIPHGFRYVGTTTTGTRR
jgi:hypothetical protein